MLFIYYFELNGLKPWTFLWPWENIFSSRLSPKWTLLAEISSTGPPATIFSQCFFLSSLTPTVRTWSTYERAVWETLWETDSSSKFGIYWHSRTHHCRRLRIRLRSHYYSGHYYNSINKTLIFVANSFANLLCTYTVHIIYFDF